MYTKSRDGYKKLFNKNLNILSGIQKTKQYKRLIKETEKYKRFVETQWQKNEEVVLSLLRDLSGLPLPKETITVSISHPKLYNGHVIDNSKIAWGHSEDFPNYSTVYVCHELLHIMTAHKKSEVMHAIIELLADNEIRIRLNKKGRYFEHPCHDYLKPLERKMYPKWRAYLKQKNKNIIKFARKFSKIKRG